MVKKLMRKVKACYELYLFLVPLLICLALFAYLPMVGIIIAFKDFKPRLGIFNSPWAEDVFFQLKRFFGSYFFSDLMENTLFLSVGVLLSSVPLAIIFALLLNRCAGKRLKKLVQNISYMPYLISMVVFVGLLNLIFSYHGGLMNNILKLFGVEDIYWMGDAKFFRPLYIWSGVWKNTGYSAIVYLSALTGVSSELEEAAIECGANKLQRIIHVDLPAIAPVISTMTLLAVGNLLNIGFEKALLMQNSINLEYSNIIPTYVYTVGVRGGQYSFGTAVSLFNSVLNTALLVFANIFTKKFTDSSLW